VHQLVNKNFDSNSLRLEHLNPEGTEQLRVSGLWTTYRPLCPSNIYKRYKWVCACMFLVGEVQKGAWGSPETSWITLYQNARHSILEYTKHAQR